MLYCEIFLFVTIPLSLFFTLSHFSYAIHFLDLVGSFYVEFVWLRSFRRSLLHSGSFRKKTIPSPRTQKPS